MSKLPTVRNTFCMACPNCGSDSSLRIYMHTWASLTPDGTDSNDSEHVWDEHDDCCCEACGHHARVAEFTLPEGDTGVVLAKHHHKTEVVS